MLCFVVVISSDLMDSCGFIYSYSSQLLNTLRMTQNGRHFADGIFKCFSMNENFWILTHWGRVTHLCVSKLTSIASDNGLSPGRRQAIIWTNAGILLIGPLETNFSEILSEIHTFSFKKMRFKMSSGKWRPFCLGLNVLNKISLKYVPLGLIDNMAALVQIMAWCW